MKVLVLSDSHGRADLALEALARAGAGGAPGVLIFAGDGLADVLPLAAACPLFFPVRGNCDGLSDPRVPEERREVLEGHSLLILHGHQLRVKVSTQLLPDRARAGGSEAVIFGHSHRQEAVVSRGVLLLNPGALCQGEYALLHAREGRPLRAELRRL